MTPRYARAALRDAEEAIAFVAADNPAAAARLAARLDAAAKMLVSFPGLGLPHGQGRRVFSVSGSPFRLVYRRTRRGIMILRIWHGARGWPPISS